MITLKTPSELQIMADGGRMLADILARLIEEAKPGITGLYLDNLAEKLITGQGGYPSFKTVSGYKYATCLSLNDVVVHGIPGSLPLKEGDILGIDIGMLYKGFHTDMSWTIPIGNVNQQIHDFLKTGKIALEKSIKKAKIGSFIGDISACIQDTIEKKGYSVVRNLIGHGVGKELHEDPQIPGFSRGKKENTPKLKEGMTLAIEVIYNMSDSPGIMYKNDDGWTISTRDEALSGLFEATVAVKDQSPIILTSSEKFATITKLHA